MPAFAFFALFDGLNNFLFFFLLNPFFFLIFFGLPRAGSRVVFSIIFVTHVSLTMNFFYLFRLWRLYVVSVLDMLDLLLREINFTFLEVLWA